MQTVTLQLPQRLASTANSIAQKTQQPVEDILIAWLDHAAAELPVSMMSDEQILALTNAQMKQADQDELSNLMAELREGQLTPQGKIRFDELMSAYRKGLRRKSEAFKLAVLRGLMPPLS